MSALLETSHDPLLDVQETARLLGVSAYQVRQLAREWRIPAIRLGRFWRFRLSSLQGWLADQERPAR